MRLSQRCAPPVEGKVHSSKTESGQTMAEMALVTPVLVLLFFGMTLAAFYALRASAADWGVFITGLASGSYNNPATEQALESVLWPDIRNRIAAGEAGDRQVHSIIQVDDARPWVFGINLIEAQHAEIFFRLWRFYPGPPDTGGSE